MSRGENLPTEQGAIGAAGQKCPGGVRSAANEAGSITMDAEKIGGSTAEIVSALA
jgi:hypothetical protein